MLSLQRYRSDGLCVAINRGWELLWQIPREMAMQYNILEDPQLRGTDHMTRIEGAFHDGVAVELPPIRYDPQVNAQFENSGQAAWVASMMAPVCDAEGAVQEVIQLHMLIGEQRQTEEELLADNRRLEAAVLARTAELEQKLGLIEEQRDAIRALSTPVLQVWHGVLAVPLIGELDRERARILQETLLRTVAETGAEHVLIDLTGVPVIDREAAGHLCDAMRATRLLGSSCALVGISAAMARTFVALDLNFDHVPTFATLQDGLRSTMSARGATASAPR